MATPRRGLKRFVQVISDLGAPQGSKDFRTMSLTVNLNVLLAGPLTVTTRPKRGHFFSFSSHASSPVSHVH